MKNILLFLLCTYCSIGGKTQPPVGVFADPSVLSVSLTDLSDNPVNANALSMNAIYLLKVDVQNLSQSTDIPSGTTRIRMGLGTKFIVNPDPAYNLANAPFSNYFNWTETTLSQVLINGDLILDLPKDFVGTLVFQVKCAALGNSTISAQFFISNHNNPNFILSDDNPNNNSASLQYSVTTILPNFLSIKGFVRDCSAIIEWAADDEGNVASYEVLGSENGIDFETKAVTKPQPDGKYSLWAGTYTGASKRFFRVRSLDKDGTIKTTNIITLQGFCNGSGKGKIRFVISPNPFTNNGVLNIKATENAFNGKYSITIMNMLAQPLYQRYEQFSNATNFQLRGLVLPKGIYLVKVLDLQTNDEQSVKFTSL